MQTGTRFSCHRIAIPDRTAASQSPPKPDWGQNIVSEEVPGTNRRLAGVVPVDVKSQRKGAGDLSEVCRCSAGDTKGSRRYIREPPEACRCGADGCEKPKRRCRRHAGRIPVSKTPSANKLSQPQNRQHPSHRHCPDRHTHQTSKDASTQIMQAEKQIDSSKA